ncbi:hypothetical protein ACFV4K_12555 [Nocardia sp. NPDC059764]|uniref:hypothetical protein n=1 Tax=Nocardia sp. NPDC059764 TaxID=3346939 RepID=UPI00366A41C6
MTTPLISARTVALGYSAPAADDLANYLRSSGIDRIALRGAIAITEPLRTAALAEIAQAIDGLLNISLAQVAVEGWCRYDRLLRAADRTRRGGVSEKVPLLEHEISHTYHPALEVYVDDQQVSRFEITVDISLRVLPLEATVRGGRLVELGPGDCTATVSIGTPDLGPILVRDHTFQTSGAFDLRRPITLSGPSPRTGTPRPR